MGTYLLITIVENRVEEVVRVTTDSIETHLRELLRAYAEKHGQDAILEDLDASCDSDYDWGVSAHPYKEGWYYAFSYLSENVDFFAIPEESIEEKPLQMQNMVT